MIRKLTLIVCLFVGGPAGATCDAWLKVARLSRAGVLASVLATTGSLGPAAATELMTAPDVRQELIERHGYTSAEADRVLAAIASSDPARALPITGVITTAGWDTTFFYGTHVWPNVSVSFKDAAAGRVVRSSCLFDMIYSDGGLVMNVGYRWLTIVVLGDLNTSTLASARFGPGFGLALRYGMGSQIEYLPAATGSAGLLVIGPQVGAGGGFRFPKITFRPAVSCP